MKTMKSVKVVDGRFTWPDDAAQSALLRTMAKNVPHYEEYDRETATYVVYHYETQMVEA